MNNKTRILEINQQIAQLEQELFSLVQSPTVEIRISGAPGSGKTTICALILNALQDKVTDAGNIVYETDPPSTKSMYEDFNDLVNQIEEYDFQLNRKIRIIEDSGKSE